MLGALTPIKQLKKQEKIKLSLAFTNAQMRQRALFNQVLNEPKREFLALTEEQKRL